MAGRPGHRRRELERHLEVHLESQHHLLQGRYGWNPCVQGGVRAHALRLHPGNGDRGAAGQYRLIFSGGAPGQFGNPAQLELYNYPVIPQNNVAFTTAYGGDTWTIARRLTLELG